MSDIEMAQSKISVIIADELRDYDPVVESISTGAMGRPLAVEWHKDMVASFTEALVEPYIANLALENGSETSCWVTTGETMGYCVVYVPKDDEFCLVLKSATKLQDINIRGDAIDCFGSI